MRDSDVVGAVGGGEEQDDEEQQTGRRSDQLRHVEALHVVVGDVKCVAWA
ncbi:hypothetical protein NG701_18505 [Pseudarthrobacter sp. HLT3-5]|nr:hypothetical protein [Pseudarthrobacter sp. HLT3-5]MCO4276387.1 hypothetical protein [Pseudarthrobacter sp. HLT3-5]